MCGNPFRSYRTLFIPHTEAAKPSLQRCLFSPSLPNYNFSLCDNNISRFIFLYILSSQKRLSLYNKRTSNTKMKQIILFTVSLLIAISTQAVETEKEFILILNSTLANGTWDKDFNKELQDHCHKRSNLYLDSYTLSFPSADTEKILKNNAPEYCRNMLRIVLKQLSS